MYQRYINYCKTQIHLEITDCDFKMNPNYTYILEHVTPEYATEYLNILQNKFERFYQNNLNYLKDVCTINDQFGKTIKYKFANFMECSPSNLRYILHALLILEYIGTKKLNNIDFIEIGGGYGGLCLFIYKLAPLFNIKINSYTIFDLLEASQLQRKYLSALNIMNVNYYQVDFFSRLKRNSFLISNYAFSEIPIEIQEKYIERVITPYVSYGLIAWNNIPVYKFINNSIIEKEKEYPLTSDTGFNFYIRFYPETSV